ncbi:MAG TPA: hypothetical protein PLD46_01275 [Hyphomicrobium sp.]|nr:hypothetical protein [Hyphomicrobium sp.]
MTHSDTGTERTIVVSPTDAKQGSRKRMNLRVLIGSMIGITLLGAILLFAFFKATPPGMDASQTGSVPAATEPAPTQPTPAP